MTEAYRIAGSPANFSAVARDLVAMDLIELLKEGRKRGLTDNDITAAFVAVLVHCAVEMGRQHFHPSDMINLVSQVYAAPATQWAEKALTK
jgi:hypothetical protein